VKLSAHRFGLGFLGLLALAAVLLLPGLGAAPLERAEIYFVDVARAMVERGDYLVPRYQGEAFFDKPPLTYWLMAAAFRLFGSSLQVARMVPVVATLLVIAATVWLGTLLVGRRSALRGGLVLTTTCVFVGFGRVAMSDMLLTLWSTLALTLALLAHRRSAAAWVVPALGVVLGLGFLTKGPIALLLPGLGILVLAWYRRHLPFPPGPVALAQAALLFALVGLGWFGLIYLQLGAGPLEYFFLRENLQRFAGETYDAGRPVWYYLATYLGEGLPWSLFLPLALWRDWRKPAASAPEQGARFLAVWLGLMLVPISLSRGKLDYYLLPLFPAASLLLGRYFRPPWGFPQRVFGGVVLGLVGVLLGLAVVFPYPLPEAWLPAPGIRHAVTGLALLLALTAALLCRRPERRRVLVFLAAVSTSLFFAMATFFLPAFRSAQPNAAIVADVVRELRYVPEASVAVCADGARVERDLLFTARATVEPHCQVYRLVASGKPYLLLVDGRQRVSLSHIEGMREVRTYHYLPAGALTLRGLSKIPDPQPLTLMASFPTDDPVAERKRKRARKRALHMLDVRGLPHPGDE
jgi:4-amino-4-deoxy-L-arabinose transferase-like glycosyltransferase